MPELQSRIAGKLQASAGGPFWPTLEVKKRRRSPDRQPEPLDELRLRGIGEDMFKAVIAASISQCDSWSRYEFEQAYRAEALTHGLLARSREMNYAVAYSLCLAGYASKGYHF